MKIRKFELGPIGNNVFILSNDKQEAIVIDTASEMEPVIKYFQDNSLKLLAVLLTHGHFDHTAGVKCLKDLGAKIYMHSSDLHKINEKDKMAQMLGIVVKPFDVDYILDKDQQIQISNFLIDVICTPGHTEGGVCYLIDNNLFSGDTMFKDSFGRIDFYDSNPDKMKSSLLKLYKLNENITVYSGHGESTSIKREKANNLQGLI